MIEATVAGKMSFLGAYAEIGRKNQIPLSSNSVFETSMELWSVLKELWNEEQKEGSEGSTPHQEHAVNDGT